MNDAASDRVRMALMTYGPLSAAELVARTGVSQPSVSRAVAELGASVLRVRSGHGIRYALRRSIGRWGNRWPVYEIGSDGEPALMGNLSAVHGGCHLEWDAPNRVFFHGEHENGLFPDLPWFIQDMRPRGYIGREMAHAFETPLHISGNPERWTSDEILIAILVFTTDLTGSYIIGRERIDEYMKRRAAASHFIHESKLPEVYPVFANEFSSGEQPKSSAGGEQPKFAITAGTESEARQVIVKFSGMRSNPVGRRWADLLVAEHLAEETLIEAGIPAAKTRIMESADRTFLEVTRFDRVGHSGRRAVVTFEAFDAGVLGSGEEEWGEAIPALLEHGFISAADAAWLATAYQFGLLIGNDDMHPGNLAFFLTSDFPLPVAPIYDMLPMQYRPRENGDLPAGLVRFPPARPEQRAARQKVVTLASEFWRKVAEDPRISRDFRGIAEANVKAVAAN